VYLSFWQQDKDRACGSKALRAVALLLFLCLSTHSLADIPRVLFINSYHHGFPWSDGLQAGFENRLKASGMAVDLRIEYLDTKHHQPDIIFPVQREFLARKYPVPPDVLVVTDNNALNFAIRHRDELFRGVPLVFAGINRFNRAMLQGDRLSTGVVEATDPTANLMLIRALHPDLKKVLLVSDETPTGKAEQARFTTAAAGGGYPFEVESYSHWSFAELKLRLSQLSDDTVVFRLPLHRDRNAQSLPLQQSIELLSQYSPVPVYSAWDTAVAAGLTGGIVTSGRLQGVTAANMVIQIMQGRSIAQLPVQKISPTEPIFNADQLKRFGISKNSLPENSTVLGDSQDGIYLFTAAAVLVAITSVIVLLWLRQVWTRQRRLLIDQRNEVARQHQLVRMLMDSNSDLIYMKDLNGRYLECNEAFSEFCQFPRESLIGKTPEQLDLDTLVRGNSEAERDLLASGDPIRYEEWARFPGQKDLLLEVEKRPLLGADQSIQGIIAVGRDITHERYDKVVLQLQQHILHLLVKGAPVSRLLLSMVEMVEQAYPDMICSVLLLDDEGKRLQKGAAPSLPDYYNDAINGLEIGEGVGSCGTAAATGEFVMVEDVMEHPYWEPYRELAEKVGIRTCWSQPIIGTSGSVLGTFAIYYREPKVPSTSQLELIQQAASLISLAIERKRAEAQLHKLSRAVEQSPSMVVITDAEGRIEYVNSVFTETTGYQFEEVKGKTPAILNSGEREDAIFRQLWDNITSGKDWQGELRNRSKSGDLYWTLLSISPIVDEDQKITHFIGISEDISELKANQQQIESLAFYDPLTSLGNRRLFREQLEHELKVANRKESLLALFYLDLDNFKQVNDSLGHDSGDLLLQEVAQRLTATLRDTDMVSRLGGDEFTILLPDVNDAAEVSMVAEKILAAFQAAVRLKDQEVIITTSIGITMAPEDGRDWSVLMKNADLAMYRAKQQGRNNYQFFTSELNETVMRRLHMQQELRTAMDEQQFLLYFQPQWNLLGNVEMVGAEALIRWQHPEKGWISPGDFIPVAEELGLIVPIGRWVIYEACRAGRELYDSGHSIRVAINLSLRQFRDPELLNTVQAALDETALPPHLVEFEITESMIMDDIDQVLRTLNALKALGTSLAIDDFGTGYSSLNYLKQLPVDLLKVDASFVRDIPHDRNDMEITAAVIAMAHKLGLKVVAEGVETQEQLSFLRDNGCEMGQGYLLAKPASLEALMDVLDFDLEQ